MKAYRLALAAAFVTGFLSPFLTGGACQTLHPSEGPGTSYPCGVWGVECLEGTCCPYKHECGGHRGYFTTCPEGYCCYTGDDWPRVGVVLGDSGVKTYLVKAAPRSQ
jgi:hypothetical protein